VENPHTHHDALEFPDGQIVLLTHLRAGQHASVLQLPAQAKSPAELEVQVGVAASADAEPIGRRHLTLSRQCGRRPRHFYAHCVQVVGVATPPHTPSA
jgi:hypothetical protein